MFLDRCHEARFDRKLVWVAKENVIAVVERDIGQRNAQGDRKYKNFPSHFL